MALCCNIKKELADERAAQTEKSTEQKVVGSVAQQIGKGNLAVSFNISGDNGLSDMLLGLHHMHESLDHFIMRLQESATSVTLSPNEIAVANLDLSARTESQANSLEETVAAMEQMTATVQQNASATKLANDLSGQASTNAQEVGELVGQMVETMHDIHSSSQRINDIIGVIDSIAFQTNILALNAAVEAARAGEQAAGIQQVGQAVAQLDETTQQNAALVEEAAAATHNINEQVQALKMTINRFQIGTRTISSFT